MSANLEYTCDICGKTADQSNVFKVYNYDILNGWGYFCSPSCLVEWAWNIKEKQEKLSKSHMMDIVP